MLISVHLPKTAGSSFLAALDGHFGPGLLRDYADLPINTPVTARNASAVKACLRNLLRCPAEVRCVHGHFLPLKYLFCCRRNVKFVTWLRDPLERVASHYFFWPRSYDPQNSPPSTAGWSRKSGPWSASVWSRS